MEHKNNNINNITKEKYSILIRYSEIALKGKNKGDFERKLVQNIKDSLKKQEIKDFKVDRKFSRIIIETNTKDIDLTKVFGIYSYSFSKIAKTSIEGIKETTEQYFLNDFNNNTTFRVSAQRLDKTFPINSTQIEREIGAFIVEKMNSKVNLKNFEKEIGIEIIDKICYIYNKKIRGPGGLPIGIEGRVFVLIENKNSIDAAIQIMKRGCQIIPLAYEEKNIEKINEYLFKELKLEIIKEEKDIDELAEKFNAKAIIVGQTFRDFKEINTNLLILRPLIAI